MVDDPLLGARRPQIGRVTLIQFRRNILSIVPDFLGPAIESFLGIVFMAIDVADVTEIVIESAVQRVRRPVRRGRRRLALQPPFADGRRGVTGLAQHRGEGVIIFQGLVELVVAHIGVSLVDAQHERSAGRRAHRRRTVMMRQLHALRREGIEVRCQVPWLVALVRRLAAILPEHAQITPAQVIGEDEQNVGTRRRSRCLWSRRDDRRQRQGQE